MLEQEIRKLGEFVVQTYKGINDYRAGLYPHLAARDARAFPLIVTLEEWFAFGPDNLRMLDESVRVGLAAAGLSSDMADEMPYTICSVATSRCSPKSSRHGGSSL